MMKNYFSKIFILGLSVIGLNSCELFSYDNYDGPDASINGVIVDQEGNPIQVEHGGGARIKMLDYGYSENPQEFYLNVKDDGSFVNNKIFASTYDIVAEGPFVPLIQVDEESNIIKDNSLKGVTEKDFKDIVFKVEPYLLLDWVGEPEYDEENNTIKVRFTMKRGTSNTKYMKPISDVYLFINTVQYVGNGNFDKFCSKQIKGNDANNMLDKENIIISNNDGVHKLEKGRPYYIRVGARTDLTSVWGGTNYNYTTVKKIVIP